MLQCSLYDAFHHRLDRKDAKTQTIGEFLESVKNGIATGLFFFMHTYPCMHMVGLVLENSHSEYSERIEGLKRAWDLIGANLKTHSEYH